MSATQEDNELICTQLLGWRKEKFGWVTDNMIRDEAAQFTDWYEAGFILEALAKKDISFSFGTARTAEGAKCYGMGIDGFKYATIRDNGPQAIRDCAIMYLKKVEWKTTLQRKN